MVDTKKLEEWDYMILRLENTCVLWDEKVSECYKRLGEVIIKHDWFFTTSHSTTLLFKDIPNGDQYQPDIVLMPGGDSQFVIGDSEIWHQYSEMGLPEIAYNQDKIYNLETIDEAISVLHKKMEQIELNR